MIFQEETIDDVLAGEYKALFEKHYHEIAWQPDAIPLKPDYEMYGKLNKLGIVVNYAVREEGKLLGYAVWIVKTHMHYTTTLFAKNDILYIDPDFRGSMLGIRLLQFCEEELKKRGVKVLSLHIKKVFDWGRVVERLGYENVETSYCKLIGD